MAAVRCVSHSVTACRNILGETLGVPIHVFGPETHMTAIVGMALGKRAIPPTPHREGTTANFLLPGDQVLIPFLYHKQ